MKNLQQNSSLNLNKWINKYKNLWIPKVILLTILLSELSDDTVKLSVEYMSNPEPWKWSKENNDFS